MTDDQAQGIRQEIQAVGTRLDARITDLSQTVERGQAETTKALNALMRGQEKTTEALDVLMQREQVS